MRRGARAALLLAAFAVPAGLLALAASAQRLPWQTSAFATQRPQDVQYLFPDQVAVKAGHAADIELHFRVRPGMHINSHTPTSKWLIATKLTLESKPGVQVLGVTFPAGESFALAAAPTQKLSVYSGEFAVKARIRAQSGQHILQGSLRYQACDTNSCYPPREAPVAMDVIGQ